MFETMRSRIAWAIQNANLSFKSMYECPKSPTSPTFCLFFRTFGPFSRQKRLEFQNILLQRQSKGSVPGCSGVVSGVGGHGWGQKACQRSCFLKTPHFWRSFAVLAPKQIRFCKPLAPESCALVGFSMEWESFVGLLAWLGSVHPISVGFFGVS